MAAIESRRSDDGSPQAKPNGFVAARVASAVAPATVHIEVNSGAGRLDLHWPLAYTREASDRWLVPHLRSVDVDLELGSNEAVKRAVAAGLGLGCLSRHTVDDAIKQGWLVEVRPSLSEMRRTRSIVTHRSKKLGSVSQDFLQHCIQSASR